MEKEIWKPIKEYEGLYEISNTKKIKRLKRLTSNNKMLREKLMVFSKNGGYDIVCLTKNRNKKIFYVDKLMREYYDL